MKVAIYCRVSTEEQSNDTQRASCMNYCKQNGHDVVMVYEDKISGTTDSRPQFNMLLNDMRIRKFEGIVVYRLDRIGRSLKHLFQLFEEFENRGIKFISVTQSINTDTIDGKLFLRMMMVFAEYERELITSRTRERIGLYKQKLKEDGQFVSKDNKVITNLGRPKGSKDKKIRRKSGYLLRWANKSK